MKRSGFQVRMHLKSPCDERDRLSSECSRLLAEWLAWKDEVSQTKKNDRAYGEKLELMKEVHRKLKAANEELTQHAIRDHGCW
jgi:hypothetical protein